MQLHYSTTSPYVRKVTVTAHELGLMDRIELLPTNGWEAPTELTARNPLSKIPCLVTEAGLVLYDSPVICEYLATLAGGLLPKEGPERWHVLRNQALADGILDAAVNMFLEINRREPEMQSSWWLGLQQETIERALDALNDEQRTEAPDLGQITLGCALGYLDFRFADMGWRDGRPDLEAWYAQFAQRPSMLATIPRDPV
jgi:glutathione S-transferase